MQNLIQYLIQHLGAETLLQVALPMEIETLTHKDRSAIVRAGTVSEAVVRKLCAKSGADVAGQLSRRDALASAFADFVLGFAPPVGG